MIGVPFHKENIMRARTLALGGLLCMSASLMGCLENPAIPSAAPSGKTGKTWTDPQSGVVFEVNPNWRRLEAPAGLAKENTTSPAPKGDFTDWSGTIMTRIYLCSTTGTHTEAVCNVEPDYVGIGGGAYADYGTGAGALLTSSYPAGFYGWAASAKDHKVACTHRLDVYAIGLKVAGMSAATLRSNLKWMQVTSSPAVHYPQAVVPSDPNIFWITGGVRVDWQDYGNSGSLMVDDSPNDFTWEGASMDLINSNIATVTTYAIGLPITMPGYNGNLWGIVKQSGSPYVDHGVGIASVSIDPGSVLVGTGGEAILASGSYQLSAGRFLFGMRPEGATFNTVSAYTKDHVNRRNGYTNAYVSQLQKLR
jgi:hypothetical protein